MNASEVLAPTNIGPKGRRQRLMLGVVFGLVYVGMVVWIALTQPPMALRWWAALPLFIAALGFFQASAGT